MKRRLKFLIILVIIIMVIIIGALVYMMNISKNKKVFIGTEEIYYSDQDTHFRNNIEKVSSKYEFFDTNTCIQKYITTLQKIDKSYYSEQNGIVENMTSAYKEELYNLLDTEYVKESNLSLNNIDKNFSAYYVKNLDFQTTEMYVWDIEDSLTIYFVYGNLINTNKNTIEAYGFIVKRDTENLLFTIMPYEYMMKNDYKQNKIQEIKVSDKLKERIQKNDNNFYTSNAYDNQYVSNYYFNIYKTNLQFNIDSIYNSMDTEYREKKYKTLQDYKNYVSKYYDQLLKCNLNQYIVEDYEDYKKYICKDQFDNYYIFKESEIGKYTLILDTYTLVQEKFNEKYKTATNREKVSMNINKFFEMINTKDYKSAYSVLSDNFKSTNFRTEEVFERYMKGNLYSYNEVNLVDFSDKISGVYTYYIEISNKENNNDKKIKMNIIMELKEDISYKISFQIID